MYLSRKKLVVIIVKQEKVHQQAPQRTPACVLSSPVVRAPTLFRFWGAGATKSDSKSRDSRALFIVNPRIVDVYYAIGVIKFDDVYAIEVINFDDLYAIDTITINGIHATHVSHVLVVLIMYVGA